MSMLLLRVFALALALVGASALSASICDNVGATWNTGGPRLTGTFPYYSMLFYCEGNLNLEALPVDSCVNSGKNCGQPAADAFCRYMGFEQAVEDLFTTVQADGPTRSLTGMPAPVSQGLIHTSSLQVLARPQSSLHLTGHQTDSNAKQRRHASATMHAMSLSAGLRPHT